MPFQFQKTDLSGLMLIKPHLAPDGRGIYKKYYEKNIFAKNGITESFTESSDIISKKGVLRGIHYQTENPQAKLLHVICGAIFDVAVDLRKDSPTFGKWQSFFLRAEDHMALFIPGEFGHGFLCLQENTVFSYQCSGKYIPAACGGIAWDDESLSIPWPLDKIDQLILSEKDRHNLKWKDYLQTPKG